MVQPGDTWHFQAWHRDASGGAGRQRPLPGNVAARVVSPRRGQEARV